MKALALISTLLLYVGIGTILAIVTLGLARFRRVIDRVAQRVGMRRPYGRLVWLAGTVVAWPVGLFVLATGRLVLVDDETAKAAAPHSSLTESDADPPAPSSRSSSGARHRSPLPESPPIAARNWSIRR